MLVRMNTDSPPLPDSIDALKALVRGLTLEIERLKAQIAKLKRMQFGRSSEKLDRAVEQLELLLDDLREREAEKPVEQAPATTGGTQKPVRRPLPQSLPREEIVHQAACT